MDKIAYVHLFSIYGFYSIRHWLRYQLDIENAFLYGDLAKEVYMEQSAGFVA